MADEMLDRLGIYFEKSNEREVLKWTFENFLYKWENGYYDHTYDNINTDILLQNVGGGK